MRIDFTLISGPLVSRVERADILGVGADRVGFLGSDHSPILLEISDDRGQGEDQGKTAAANS